MSLIINPFPYFPDPARGRPLYNSKIYIGQPDLSPEQYPQDIYYVLEDGSTVPAPNPVTTGSGGVVMYNGMPVQISVGTGDYSMLVRDSSGAQVFYIPSFSKAGGTPTSVYAKTLLASYSGFSYQADWTPRMLVPANSLSDKKCWWSNELSKFITPISDAERTTADTFEEDENMWSVFEPADKSHVEEELVNIKDTIRGTLNQVSVTFDGPARSAANEYLMNTYGYDYTFPQGMAYDELNQQLFITCYAHKGGSVEDAWIDCYDYPSMSYIATFGAGKGFVEGAAIETVNGVRKLIIGGESSTFLLYDLPSDISTIDKQILSPVKTLSVYGGSQMSYYNGYVSVVTSKNSVGGGRTVRNLLEIHRFDELIETPSVVTYIPLDINCSGGSLTDAPGMVVKQQGHALTPGGIIASAASNWVTSSGNKKGSFLSFHEYTNMGDRVGGVSVDPTKFQLSGIVDQSVQRLEPQGVVYANGDVLSQVIHTINGVESVKILKHYDSQSDKDLSKCAGYNISTDKGTFASLCDQRPLNRITGEYMSNCDDIINYMAQMGIGEYSFGQLFGQTRIKVGDYEVPDYSTVTIRSSNLFHFNVQVSGVNTFREVTTQLTNYPDPLPYAYNGNPWVGGNPLNSGDIPSNIIQAPNGWAQHRYIVRGGSDHTPLLFVNVNGQIGSVTMSANETSFNKTSDERKKNRISEIKGALELISKSVSDGSVAMASFKSDPEKVKAMFMAQSLAKHLPECVSITEGTYQVDYSSPMPLIFAAIAEINEKLKTL